MIKFLKYLFIYAFVFLLFFLVVEVGLKIFDPLQYIIPVSDFTPEYGVIAYPEEKIINAKPNHFYYTYTTNKLRYRGDLIPFNSSTRKIILLGDSNIFGFGVQDNETISHNLNKLLGTDFDVINLGNGGWSLPQEVRRYIELGSKYKPEVVILLMVAGDLEDHVYGINWVAIANKSKDIDLRTVPINPAGKLRKFLPPDSFLSKTVFRSQVMMRVKILLNSYSLSHLINVKTSPDGSSLLIHEDIEKKAVSFPYEKVTVFDRDENERRYSNLLEAFAQLLESENVRFIFLTGQYHLHDKILSEKVSELATSGLLEHYVVDNWFIAGVDYPISPQGHQWNADATKALAKHLYQVIGISN